MKNELIVLLPAYNEELNIEKMVAAWKKQEELLVKQYKLVLKIVVVNDGSKDRTADICQTLSNIHNNFNYISHSKNKGLGAAVKTAILHLIQNCPDCKYACVMDCDNTQDPSYICNMLDKIGEGKTTLSSDVIIASRYHKGSKIQGVSKYRLFTSEGAKYVYSAILPVKNVRDYTCGYRLYTSDILKSCYQCFGNSIIEESGFTCMAELLYKLHVVGARFDEIPFELRYDYKQGKSKMKVMKTAIYSIKLAFHLRSLEKNKM